MKESESSTKRKHLEARRAGLVREIATADKILNGGATVDMEMFERSRRGGVANTTEGVIYDSDMNPIAIDQINGLDDFIRSQVKHPENSRYSQPTEIENWRNPYKDPGYGDFSSYRDLSAAAAAAADEKATTDLVDSMFPSEKDVLDSPDIDFGFKPVK